MAEGATVLLALVLAAAAAVTVGFGFCAYRTTEVVEVGQPPGPERCGVSPSHVAGGLALSAAGGLAFAHARLGLGRRSAAQAALGAAALLYTLLLLTGLVGWLLANLAYAGLALAAAAAPPRAARALAGAGLAVFALANGAIVAMGGAFLVGGALVLLGLPQALLLWPTRVQEP